MIIREGLVGRSAVIRNAKSTGHVILLISAHECSQMYVLDVDEDGDNDVIAASAHNYGMWWHEQSETGQILLHGQNTKYLKISRSRTEWNWWM